MMSRLFRVAVMLACLSIAGPLQAGDPPNSQDKAEGYFLKVILPPENVIYSQNAYKIPYLGIDGIFTIDTAEPVPANDPRNPKRIVFDKMEYFSFYKDIDGQKPIAENCRYYIGARPAIRITSTGPIPPPRTQFGTCSSSTAVKRRA